jgi:hypothetical protein
MILQSWALEAHACNPRYSGGRAGPGFKPQYRKKKKDILGQVQWLTTAIPATPKAKIGRIKVQSQPMHKVCETPMSISNNLGMLFMHLSS